MKRDGEAAVDTAQGAPKKPKIDAAALRAKLQKTLSTVKKLQKGVFRLVSTYIEFGALLAAM